MSTSNVPPVGAGYGGGVVTARRKDTATGLVELQVNGQWIPFNPQVKTAETSPPTYKDETNLKMAETSARDDISIKSGDTIQLVNPNCWEAKLWKIGDRATVKLVWENGTRLVIETPRSRKDGYCYTVDAENWAIVEPPQPPPPPPPPIIPEPVGFERLIGKQVEFEGRTYTLLDYLPACQYCQISGHGETKCVPENLMFRSRLEARWAARY